MYRVESDQEKLERLKKLDVANRVNSKRYLEKVRKAGKKQISAFLDAEPYDRLCKLRDAGMQGGKPLSFGDIIGGLLVPIVAVDGNSTVKIDLDIEKKAERMVATNVAPDTTDCNDTENSGNNGNKTTLKDPQGGGVIPDSHDKYERDDFLVMVGNKFPGRKNAQKRADVLNDAKVLIQGEFVPGQWIPKKANDHIRLAKKRSKNK